MKPKEGRKKTKSFGKRLKNAVVLTLQLMGVFLLLWGWPFLFPPKEVAVEGYKTISFQTLGAFDADKFKKSLKLLEHANQPSDLPVDVKALKGEKVAIRGYMIPLEVEKEGVKTFALVRDLASCCFGGTPKLNEWVHVTMKPPVTAPYFAYRPIVVSGTLEVEATILDQGEWSLYHLLGDNAQKV
ncbi:MAG: hypothetical protein KCHDKBKB_02531 [Elusimicrobia bacterium]|nr:hypothetical protein [Elusimicrobiota bacterium]